MYKKICLNDLERIDNIMNPDITKKWNLCIYVNVTTK